MNSVIKISHLWKHFSAVDRPVLKDVSFSVSAGTICGIIGRSGAGKSTLMRCLNGLTQPDHGQIDVLGTPLTTASISKNRTTLNKIGTVFQTFNLLSRRTVLDNIALPLAWLGIDEVTRTQKATSLANLVGLGEFCHRYPGELSGGQCQRVAIARALATDPALLLCDEFTSALDPETSLEILRLLRHLNHQLGLTVLLITHDMTVIRECCDHVIVMDQGEIVEQDSIENILLSPTHAVTKNLISGLFTKDLPQSMADRLQDIPLTGEKSLNGHVVLRLVFAGKSAGKPVIASLIQEFGVLANIIAGSLDHIRETAFGSLIITIPYNPENFASICQYLADHHVAPDILGYLDA